MRKLNKMSQMRTGLIKTNKFFKSPRIFDTRKKTKDIFTHGTQSLQTVSALADTAQNDIRFTLQNNGLQPTTKICR